MAEGVLESCGAAGSSEGGEHTAVLNKKGVNRTVSLLRTDTHRVYGNEDVWEHGGENAGQR